MVPGMRAKRRRYECRECKTRWSTIEIQVGPCTAPGERVQVVSKAQMQNLARRVKRVFYQNDPQGERQ